MIDRGLEGLWLLAAFLIPLAFLGQQYSLSEAQIAYVEVPKVALLRTLAAAILLLWSVEWAIKSHAFQGSFSSISIKSILDKWQPQNRALEFNKWLKTHPTRWFLLAAVLFFASTFVSTALSGSRTNSIWGEIPGQDGYSAYTIAAYATLFGVIATHLKRPAQLGRLLGVIILMGFLVGLYGIFQHFGHDFLNLTESTGGGTSRVTIFMGNAIFAAAVLSMTVPLTLVAASLSFDNTNWRGWEPFSKLDQLAKDGLTTTIWAVVLSVQLIGLMFTFSRGPWAGAVLALVVFLGLVVLSVGWRPLIRIGSAIGLAGVFSVAFLHWQGSISIVNTGPWLGPALALLGLAGTITILSLIERFGRAAFLIAATGSVVIIVGASIFALPILADDGTVISKADGVAAESTTSQVGQRVASIGSVVLGGFAHGRDTHWKVSWTLIKDRPWFQFDDLGLSWLRPMVGYGPDLLRYTYLLVSPVDEFKFLPLEPDHAHNFFIHQTVEQGIVGGLTSLALFVSVFGVVAHRILRLRRAGDTMYRLLLFGLMAIVAGRFLEMMVGVARISDLTVLWVVFGLFAATVNFEHLNRESGTPDARQTPEVSNRRGRRPTRRRPAARTLSTGLITRLAIVVWLIGGIGVITWQKGINPVRASVAGARAFESFKNGDLDNSVKEFDQAIRLAPRIPTYYNNLAQVYLAYQIRVDHIEASCFEQEEVEYQTCLGILSLESNLESVRQQPFFYRARMAAGNSAYNLQLNKIAIDSYRNASTMVPQSHVLRNNLAELYIDTGSYALALEQLESSLDVTGDTLPVLALKGRAQLKLGDINGAEKTVKQSIALASNPNDSQVGLDLIDAIYEERIPPYGIKDFDQQISRNPVDAVAFYFRGLEHLQHGDLDKARSDIGKSVSLGLVANQVLANLSYLRLQYGFNSQDIGVLKRIANTEPNKALYNVYLAESQILEGKYDEALSSSLIAYELDSELESAYLSRARTYINLGLGASAGEVLDASMGLDISAAGDYFDRGQMFAFVGNSELAISDLDEAIRINPNIASFYNARGRVYGSRGDFDSALTDFNFAIQLDPANGNYLVNRGVLYSINGMAQNPLDDLSIVESRRLGYIPEIEKRNNEFFKEYNPASYTKGYRGVFTKLVTIPNTPSFPSTSISNADARENLKSRTEIATISKIESLARDEFKTLLNPQLQALGGAYLKLEMWAAAADIFSRLLNNVPGDSETLRDRGDSLLRLKIYGASLEDYERAVSTDPFDEANFIARGKGFAAIGNYDRAESDFDIAIRLNPKSSEAYKFKGHLSVLAGDYSLAFAYLDQAIKLSPLDQDAYFIRAKAHLGIEDPGLALSDFEHAINLAPTNTDYLFNRGLLHSALADYESALEDFSGAIRLDQRLAGIDPRHAEPYVGRGRIYLLLENLNQAVNDARSAIQLLEGNLRMPEWISYKSGINLQLADAHELLGDAYTQLGNNEEAQSEYKIVASLR